MAEPQFSALICTIPERAATFFATLSDRLERQLRAVPDGSVEILSFGDNRQRSVGAKRNGILSLARGEFCAFIDDDDEIADDYLVSIIETITANPHADVIVFDQDCIIDDGPVIACQYGVELEYTWDGGPKWYGKPAHTMVWRTALAKSHKFPEIQCGEDTAWAKACSADVREQVRIEKTLYRYIFNSQKSRTRGL